MLDLPRKIVILIYSAMLSLRLVFIHFYQRIYFIFFKKDHGFDVSSLKSISVSTAVLTLGKDELFK